ncbi:MAG: hypothetical protein ACFFER_16660, partial [Candidatus Thorarchaeota archaeon]
MEPMKDVGMAVIWGLHYMDIESQKKLTRKEKDYLIQGVDSLVKMFKDHPDSFLEDKELHPLTFWILSKPGEIWWFCHLARIGHIIDSFRNTQGFETVEQRLRNSRFFFGALAEIETAALLRDCGATVEFLKPTEKRTADLIIAYQDKAIYVEVTTLEPTDEEWIQYQRMLRLHFSLRHEPGIDCALRANQKLSGKRVTEYMKNIRKGIEDVTSGVDPIVEYQDEFVEYIITLSEMKHIVDAWRLARGLPANIALSYPAAQPKTGQRIRQRLKNKSFHQMNPDKPWIFHLSLVPHVLQWALNPVEVTRNIEDLLEDQSHLLLSIVSSWNEGTEKDIRSCEKISNSYFKVRGICSKRVDSILLTPNKYSKFKDM